MKKENIICYKKGIHHGIPIALGYLAVSFTLGICWIVGIGDLENIHYSRVSNAPMNL